MATRPWLGLNEQGHHVDRKELKNKYKETIQPMGIFQIRNMLNGKIFLGSSTNLPGIINRNRFQLKNGLHMNREMQRDFLEAGEGNFAFEILDTLKPKGDARGDYGEELRMLEDLWLEKLRPALETGYNHA